MLPPSWKRTWPTVSWNTSVTWDVPGEVQEWDWNREGEWISEDRAGGWWIHVFYGQLWSWSPGNLISVYRTGRSGLNQSQGFWYFLLIIFFDYVLSVFMIIMATSHSQGHRFRWEAVPDIRCWATKASSVTPGQGCPLGRWVCSCTLMSNTSCKPSICWNFRTNHFLYL